MKRDLLIDFRGRKNQSEMAKRYGVSQQLWSCWENGLSTPPPHIMKQIEIDSNIPMEDIFYDAFHKNF